jgi:hypothetical protein
MNRENKENRTFNLDLSHLVRKQNKQNEKKNKTDEELVKEYINSKIYKYNTKNDEN